MIWLLQYFIKFSSYINNTIFQYFFKKLRHQPAVRFIYKNTLPQMLNNNNQLQCWYGYAVLNLWVESVIQKRSDLIFEILFSYTEDFSE